MGAVSQYLKVRAKAVEMIENSHHVDADTYVSDSDSDDDSPNRRKFTRDFDVHDYIDSSDDDDDVLDVQVPDDNAQDLHKLLQVILASYKDIQDRGGF